MKAFPIPVVAVGPGSHEEDEALEYIPSPGEMSTFNVPRLPEVIDPVVRDEVLGVLGRLLDGMRAWSFGDPDYPEIDLAALSVDAITLVNEALGQGEVSIVAETERGTLRVQETVFAGVWRELGFDPAQRQVRDVVSAAPVPGAIGACAQVACSAGIAVPSPPSGVMNAPSILAELVDVAARWKAGDAAHIVNLTLLPLVPDDLAYLDGALGAGSVVVLSRGYGNCRVSSTRLANTWWVQYFNSADNLILNTIEVTDMPDVVPAAAEDFGDSVERLAEWIETLRLE
ncbi:MAG: hydrogenase expression/formation protein [Azoarcus sp.]|jgi:hydrogenase-1 operon protein HyaF|nr:hydrogenase expression/formation protein [Azoarcus sp.]MDX9838063.1 hydrogenase expression/formation protein [Azoarcus sp.]